jgi:Zn-dependent membrane protease YugP
MGLFLLIGLLSLVGMYINGQLKSKARVYSQVANPARRSGAAIAQQMLWDHNLQHVQVVEGSGFLSDHYDPRSNIITLSPAIYRSGSVMAAAVAAHETGHAIQHAESYGFLSFRSAMVPYVKGAASVQQWLLIAALMLAGSFPQLLFIVMVSFLITTLFSLVTLPVEFDASNRAVQWLEQSGNAVSDSLDGAKDALKWAGLTYVAQALSSFVMLIFLAFSFLGSGD